MTGASNIVNLEFDLLDPNTRITPELIESTLRTDDDRTVGLFDSLKVGTHFQPIFSLAHQRVIGFEALMRPTGHDGQPRSPLDVFRRAGNQTEIILLDRMCCATHLRNFYRRESGDTWLFLNINPRVIVEGDHLDTFLQWQLDRLQFPAHRVVIEILESELADESALTEAVNYYRALGCLIAIDDFGAGHSNFDRIGRLRPDIVKLDRSIVVQAARDHNMRTIVPGMVSLLHEAGSLVVMEGIETKQEAMIAMDADADFVQGYYFARPDNHVEITEPPAFKSLFRQFQALTAMDRGNYRSEIAPYINGLGYSSVLLQTGHPLDVACQGFLELARSERCFLLDAEGLQIGNNINSANVQVRANPRYAPLRDAKGANWSRRHYFRRAISRPGKVQVTRPYLSAASATPCVTASIGFKLDGEMKILCGDIRWDDHQSLADRALDEQ